MVYLMRTVHGVISVFWLPGIQLLRRHYTSRRLCVYLVNSPVLSNVRTGVRFLCL
jgi:hypothetical protein